MAKLEMIREATQLDVSGWDDADDGQTNYGSIGFHKVRRALGAEYRVYPNDDDDDDDDDGPTALMLVVGTESFASRRRLSDDDQQEFQDRLETATGLSWLVFADGRVQLMDDAGYEISLSEFTCSDLWSALEDSILDDSTEDATWQALVSEIIAYMRGGSDCPFTRWD